MSYVSFKAIYPQDAENLSNLLLNSSQEYVKYFHPFDFQVLSIQEVLNRAINDRFFGIEVKHNLATDSQLIGFYMLRGIDEGYADPMYGVFVDREWQGKGIAKLSLYHAECFCQINSYKRILLKVSLNNYRARKLYESMGFQFLRQETKIDNLVLYKKVY